MIVNTFARKSVFFTIYYMLFCGFVIKNFGVDKSCMFLIDIVYLLLLFCCSFKIKSAGLSFSMTIWKMLFCVLFLGALINAVPPMNFMWGLRNQYFSLILFFASASVLCLQDIKKIFKFFFYFQFLNLACALFQYFVLGLFRDANNGAFTSGGGQDIFCGILMAYYLYQYMHKECKTWHFAFVLISSLVIAAIEEEKFIFIETVFIFSYFYFTSKQLGFKKIFIAVIFVTVIGIGINLLAQINGGWNLDVLTNKEAFMDYQENAFALPRIGSSSVIERMFFHNDWQSFFGLGLGTCEDASTLSFINTDFYNKYSWLQYTWFTFQINFMQTGWLGIFLFVAFFISIIVSNVKGKRKCPDYLKHYYDISIIITILCIMTIWYNATLRSYNSIIPFFAMSLSGIVTRQLVSQNHSNKK